MKESHLLGRMEEYGIAAVVRAPSAEVAVKAVDAVIEGGVTVVEITFTVPNAADVIRTVAGGIDDDVILGAGTVTDKGKAESAIDAGAQFVVAPNTDPDTITTSKALGAVCIPGALTPTEVVTAIECGADAVKIFPASVFGPSYLTALRGPLPGVKFMPTGGISLGNMKEFVAAGATMFGIGGNLVSSSSLKSGDYAQITANAKEWMSAMEAAREDQ
ncbi:MAG: bifunctional 4-hydroxy-2-oxoglutarate aldolase/2-dehydro-3-deoxy-phosphogluconate aldolase [Candidatus Latescibacteria bacterium]|jgi:2-dehydro-3-deoxyphosphogluconate aldolase/(4S)-4-hydroxy-2-oxoglutarate aldolase|nr:bifunctional 4-hydroxy-2-oxoglutarate aldolase/2-dehydro-3-deoxy-phosphogluconate aldolase [Candidatus Latescibacterota bacterium]